MVQQSSPRVVQRLDERFFRVRFERLTPAERNFLRPMAEHGEGPWRIGDVAKTLGKASSSSLSLLRSNLLKKGMIYSPAHGDVAFTVPSFTPSCTASCPSSKTELRATPRTGAPHRCRRRHLCACPVMRTARRQSEKKCCRTQLEHAPADNGATTSGCLPAHACGASGATRPSTKDSLP